MFRKISFAYLHKTDTSWSFRHALVKDTTEIRDRIKGSRKEDQRVDLYLIVGGIM